MPQFRSPFRWTVLVASALLGTGAIAATSHAAGITSNDAAAPRHGDERIVGGIASPEGAYPWMVRTIVRGRGFCGGTLISPDIVLTAQHCTKAAPRFEIRVGANRYADGQRRGITNFIEGPGLHRGDWAVAKLDRPVTNITPVYLPANQAYDAVPLFRTMGWGMTREQGSMTSTLREVDLPLVKHGDYGCENAHNELCAGDMRNGGKDSCQGDSGGPLASPVNGTWVQTGVVSWGEGCGRRGLPGRYTRVSSFLDDMRAAITKLGGQQFRTYDGSAPGPQPTQPAPTQPPGNPWPPRPTQPAPQPTNNPWPPRPTQPAPQPTNNPWPPRPTQPAPQPTQPPGNPWPPRPTQPAPQPTNNPWPPRPTQPAPTQPPAPQPTRPRPTWPGFPGHPQR